MSKAAPALVGLATSGVLLRRMRQEFDSSGSFSKPTAAAMYATYAALVARAATQRTLPLPLPPRLSAATGGVLGAAGVGLFVAGVRRFAGPEQVTGTEVGELVTGSVYRYSRSPQYTGYILALTGAGARRPR